MLLRQTFFQPYPLQILSDQPAHVHARRSADYILEVYQLKYVRCPDDHGVLMQYSTEQHLAKAKRLREQGEAICEPARRHLIKLSNSCLAAAVLAARERGGILTTGFDFDSLTPD